MADTTGPHGKPFAEFARHSFLHAARVAVVLLLHLTTTVVLLLCIFAVEEMFHALWPEQEPMLFGIWKLKYLFHAMDLGVVATFVILAPWQAFCVLRSSS